MTPTKISPRSLLSDLAVRWAGASRVLHRHQLDFCCHGRVSLAEACRERALSVEDLIAELEAEARDGGPSTLEGLALPELIDHILERFHADHRAELPRLIAMAEKVERVHAGKERCPVGLADHLRRMGAELEEHMAKEERILFPLVLRGAGVRAAAPISVMEQEHREHAVNLARLRELARDFQAPPEACATWRALYNSLAELERALMEHIHIENNMVFPRALNAERGRA